MVDFVVRSKTCARSIEGPVYGVFLEYMFYSKCSWLLRYKAEKSETTSEGGLCIESNKLEYNEFVLEGLQLY
jgi:hypothetical protein